jgi:hypothetical protein
MRRTTDTVNVHVTVTVNGLVNCINTQERKEK